MSMAGSAVRRAQHPAREAGVHLQRRTFLSSAPTNRHVFRRSKSSMIGSSHRSPALSVSAFTESAAASARESGLGYRLMDAAGAAGRMGNVLEPSVCVLLPTAMMLGALCAPHATYNLMSGMGARQDVRRESFPYAY